MAGRARLLALLALVTAGSAVGAGTGFTTANLAGRYVHSFRNGDVSGARFTSTDRVVIVPLDARNAVFDMELAFFNGHQCSIGGRATLEGDALVYRDPEMTGYGESGGPCTLRISRRGRQLIWGDQGSCSGNCGARGSLRDGSIAWSSRRAISRTERRRILRDHERNRSLP